MVVAGICSCICEEDIRAQVLDRTSVLRIGETELVVEVAQTSTERSRGLRYRTCGEPAMVLLPEQREPLPVWQCEVPVALDILFIREGEVVDMVAGAPPCEAPCERCPTYGEGVEVDAVLEVAAGRLPSHEIAIGTAVDGLVDAVD